MESDAPRKVPQDAGEDEGFALEAVVGAARKLIDQQRLGRRSLTPPQPKRPR